MKALQSKFTIGFLSFLAVVAFSVTGFAQDDDGIYGDIYETPVIDEEILDTVSPLDGYSTADDYYPEEGYSQEGNSQEPYSEQYVDEDGNNVTNNFYGDYYEDDDDYAYSSRIRRFHRNNNWGYYDPWYTNMYYYNYDPFYWGTSIYTGYAPAYTWRWNSIWNWGNPYGWGGLYGYPACYGGYGYGGHGYGYWNNYGNGYWNGYNNGFNDGLAYGGYYNTYDSNSGIYYGHRGYGHRGSGTGSTTALGSGYRSKSFASAYNTAALEGKVSHANKDNVLRTVNGKPLNSLEGFNDGRFPESSTAGTTTKTPAVDNERVNANSKPTTADSRTPAKPSETRVTTRKNPYQRQSTERRANVPTRLNPNNVDRSRDRSTGKPRPTTQTASRNTYQRGNSRTNATQNRGNVQRSNSNSRNYNRGNTNQNRYQQPSRSNSNSRSNSQYTRPSTERNNNYRKPSRSTTQPTRPSRNVTKPVRPSTPSRSTQPSRSTTSPNRGASGKGFSQPSRSSGSSGRSSGGSRSSGSKSRGGG